MSNTFLGIIGLASGVVILALILIARSLRKKDNTLVLIQSQMESMRSQMQHSIETGQQNMSSQMAEVTRLFVDTMGQINSQLAAQMKTISETLAERLKDNINVIQQTQHSVGERLDNASKVIADLKGKIGEIEAANRQIFDLGRELAELQNLLRAPKFRGGMAEFMLAELLSQVLPDDHYSLQYPLGNGRVDAVIRLGEGLVPVDAKFPLDGFRSIINTTDGEESKQAKRQFRNAVKKHIDDISGKYIRPEEGTFDFALMYIPAENVYYEVMLKDDRETVSLIEYALSRKIIPVSPNSFYAYLQTIVLGLRGMRIEERAKTIIRNLQQLQGDFDRFEGEFQVLGRHLSNASSKYRDLDGLLSRFGERIGSISMDTSE